MLQELIEVQTEIKMAKDALTKKSADIAVPLEQLGAEMAEEMTTNLEKWLPDTPDPGSSTRMRMELATKLPPQKKQQTSSRRPRGADGRKAVYGEEATAGHQNRKATKL